MYVHIHISLYMYKSEVEEGLDRRAGPPSQAGRLPPTSIIDTSSIMYKFCTVYFYCTHVLYSGYLYFLLDMCCTVCAYIVYIVRACSCRLEGEEVIEHRAGCLWPNTVYVDV